MSDYHNLMAAFTKESAQAMMKIAKLLRTLEIPIDMAPAQFSSGDEVIAAMHNSRNLIHEVPMPREHRAALNTVMTLWLAAMFTATHADEDELFWLLEAAVVQMIRINHELEITGAVLRGEVEIEEFRDLNEE